MVVHRLSSADTDRLFHALADATRRDIGFGVVTFALFLAVTFAFPAHAFPEVAGSGFLVPPVDGRRIKSCLTLAVMRQNAEITTIEGLAEYYAIELPHDPYLTVEEGSVSNVIGLPMESLEKS